MTTIACFCGHTRHTSARDDRCKHGGRTVTITTLADAAALNRLHHHSDSTSRAGAPFKSYT
jgi:hypothetical protein